MRARCVVGSFYFSIFTMRRTSVENFRKAIIQYKIDYTWAFYFFWIEVFYYSVAIEEKVGLIDDIILYLNVAQCF